MPADRKVSVGWQIVFTFLPIVNFWAFYRIRRLRRYVLYVILPQLILTAVYSVYIFSIIDNELFFDRITDRPAFAQESGYSVAQFDQPDPLDQLTPEYWQASLPFQLASWGLQGFSIYLVVIWSRQHNRQYDQPTVQSN